MKRMCCFAVPRLRPQAGRSRPSPVSCCWAPPSGRPRHPSRTLSRLRALGGKNRYIVLDDATDPSNAVLIRASRAADNVYIDRVQQRSGYTAVRPSPRRSNGRKLVVAVAPRPPATRGFTVRRHHDHGGAGSGT